MRMLSELKEIMTWVVNKAQESPSTEKLPSEMREIKKNLTEALNSRITERGKN